MVKSMRAGLMLPGLVLALLGATAAAAQDTAVPDSSEPPKRYRTVLLYGNEPCPTAASDEIVVCQRASAAEQFRIPPAFREPTPRPANQAWQSRIDTLNEVNRVGTPNSCSPVGAGGQTGCARQAAEAFSDTQRQTPATTTTP